MEEVEEVEEVDEEEGEKEYRTHSTRWRSSSFPRWCWWLAREGGREGLVSVCTTFHSEPLEPGRQVGLDGSSTWPARGLLSPHQLAGHQPPPRCSHKH